MPNLTPVTTTRIRLGNRYRIESDAHGWTLYTAVPSKAKDGTETIRWAPRYYGRLDHAANAIIADAPGVGGDHDDAQSIVDAIAQAAALIREAIRDAGFPKVGPPMP